MKLLKRIFEYIDFWLFGNRCSSCGCPGAHRRRMNTEFRVEEMNWTTECDFCFARTETYWDQVFWEEYEGVE